MAKSTFLQDFKAFAMKGNVIDMAVGVIIGGAFGKIVTALVNDVIMPAIGLLVGGINFKDLKVILSPEVLNEAGEIEKDACIMLNITGAGEEDAKRGRELHYLKPSKVFPLTATIDEVFEYVESLF